MNRQPPITNSSPRRLGRVVLVALVATALVGACQRQAVAASSDLLVLGIGQSAEIAPATTLRLDRIVSDSRCPADVQCVWAGEVKLGLTLTSPTGSTDFELSEMTANSAAVQTFQIELSSFGPCASEPSKATPAAECASLRISETAER